MHAATGTGRIVGGRYELLGTMGHGAMGTVWRARDPALAREVAVKEVRLPGVMTEQERQVRHERVFREARAAAKLNHPAVLTVYDVVETDGNPWIVMELVSARSLEQVIAQDGPLSPGRAAEMGLMLLGALASAHSAGIVHRDVKPANVLLTPEGRAVLTDFGIATLDGEPGLTQAGMVMGTPGFCAPERIRGAPASPASDLWSLGATLYAAVEGRGPFHQQGSPIAVLADIVHSEPPSPSLAGPLGPVIISLLSRDPGQRPDAATASRELAAVAASAFPAVCTLASPAPATPVPHAPATPVPHAPATPVPHAPATPVPHAPATPVPHAPATPVPHAPATPVPHAPATPVPHAPATPVPHAPATPASPAPATPASPAPGPAPSGRPIATHHRTPPGPSHRPPATSPEYTPAQQSPSPQAARHMRMRDRHAHADGQPGHRQPRTRSTRPWRRHRGLAVGGIAFVGAAILAAVVIASAGQSAASGRTRATHPALRDRAALPPGFYWYSGSGAPAVMAPGFSVAVPGGWQAFQSGTSTLLRDPATGGSITITPLRSGSADPLQEVRALARAAVRRGRHRGYRRIAVGPFAFRGSLGGMWRFSYRGRGGTVDALDVVATVGAKEYELSVASPAADWPATRAMFAKVIRTFTPHPT